MLTSKLKENQLTVLDKIELEAPKTKLFAQLVSEMGWSGVKTLFVTPEKDESLLRSSRNLHRVMILPPEGLNVYDLLRYDRLVVLQGAVPRIHERLG